VFESGKSGTLISPLVKFGPEGYRFRKPVEIRIPQYSRLSNASVLLGGGTDNNNKLQQQQQQKWSRINIRHDEEDNEGEDALGDIPFKIVSLTIQQF
jgi:hypothetical protein